MLPQIALEFRQFQKEHYPEYASWFIDAELNRRLGPMDQEWLEFTLAQPASDGITWAVFRDEELVAVIELVFHPTDRQQATITAVAVKPCLRRQGIGMAVLKQIPTLHRGRGICEYTAYVHVDNDAVMQYIERAGFRLVVSAEPDEHGFVEFRRSEPNKF